MLREVSSSKRSLLSPQSSSKNLESTNFASSGFARDPSYDVELNGFGDNLDVNSLNKSGNLLDYSSAQSFQS